MTRSLKPLDQIITSPHPPTKVQLVVWDQLWIFELWCLNDDVICMNIFLLTVALTLSFCFSAILIAGKYFRVIQSTTFWAPSPLCCNPLISRFINYAWFWVGIVGCLLFAELSFDLPILSCRSSLGLYCPLSIVNWAVYLKGLVLF